MTTSPSRSLTFSSLELEAFRGVARARVSLGPGLNLLFGPNDLGKSTLAEATRAALLLLYSASDGKAYQPWHGGGDPRVKLTLRREDGRWVRVEKQFGESRPAARLFVSNDGVSFSPDGTGRAVDEKLKEMLRIGIDPRGKFRGMPSSFLTQVLFAGQTEVEAILGASLEQDHDDGKLRVKEALAALAEDPRVKAILERAQAEVDAYFTPTGRLKGGKSSPFTRVRDEIAVARRELERLRERAGEARLAREQLASEQQALAGKLEDQERARAEVAQLEESRQRARRIAEAEAALGAREAALAELDAAEAKLRELEASREAANASAEAASAELQTAEADLERARAEAEEARAALEAVATEGEGAREAVERASAERRLAQISERRAELDRRLEHVEEAARAQATARELAGSVEEREAALAEARSAETGAKAEASELAERLARARQRAARVALDARRGELEAVLARVAEADELRGSITAQEEARARAQADAAALGAPGREELEAIRGLLHEVELARAQTSVGFQVEVERRAPVELEVTLDDDAPAQHPAAGSPVRLDGARSARVRVGDVAEVSLRVGSAEARDRLSTAEASFRERLDPALSRAKVDTFEALEVVAERAEALEAQAEKIYGGLEVARERLRGLEKQVEGRAALEAEVRRLEAGLAETPPPAPDEAEEPLDEAALEAALNGARTAAQAASGAVTGAEAQLDAARSALERAEGEAARRASLIDAEPEAARASANEEREGLLEEQVNLRARVAELEEAIEKRKSGARSRADRARERHDELRAAVEARRGAQPDLLARSSELGGQVSAAREHLARFDRPSLEAQRDDARRALEALPRPERPVTEEALEAAQAKRDELGHAVEELQSRLDQTKGHLAGTEGLVLDEKVEEAEGVLGRLEAQQSELELDAKAAKMLAEALVAARESSSQHLGAALAQPLGERMSALTAGRYAQVELGSTLSNEGVLVLGEKRAADTLSVGTREQMATLFRLLLAERLRLPIILDDHLVQSDATRMAWFHQTLREIATSTQVIALTCRPQDYLQPADIPEPAAPTRDLAGGLIRAINLEGCIERWQPEAATTPEATQES